MTTKQQQPGSSEAVNAVKARLYVGGLKSLFADMHDILEQIEKTGAIPENLVESLLDVKDAIDLTTNQLQHVRMRCCEHYQEQDHACEPEVVEEPKPKAPGKKPAKR